MWIRSGPILLAVLCAGCAHQTSVHRFKAHPPKSPDCQVDFRTSPPGEDEFYEELGSVEARASLTAKPEVREKLRETACSAGADLVVTEYRGDVTLSPSRGADRMDLLKATFYARSVPAPARPLGRDPAVPILAANPEPPPRSPPPSMADEARRYLAGQCGRSLLSCSLLAWRYEHGDGVARDETLATRLYEAACAAGSSEACANAGLMYSAGRGVPPDVRRAAELYDRACKEEIGQACTNLGALYGDAAFGRDEARMAALYEKGCRLEDGMGCNNLAWAYEHGQGESQDLRKAVELYRKTCDDLDTPLACFNLAVLTLHGRGTKQDFPLALGLFHRACDKRVSSACAAEVVLGKGSASAREIAEAAKASDKACKAGQPDGCVNLGWFYEVGYGVPRSASTALALYEKACAAGLAVACSNAASIYEQGTSGQRELDKANTLYRRACDLGLQAICDSRGGPKPQGARQVHLMQER